MFYSAKASSFYFEFLRLASIVWKEVSNTQKKVFFPATKKFNFTFKLFPIAFSLSLSLEITSIVS